jgi:hypothetical protein
MHGDIGNLKNNVVDLHRQVDRIDQSGSRWLDRVVDRQTNIIAAHSARDARLRDLEGKL